jgi:hypothetical protein
MMKKDIDRRKQRIIEEERNWSRERKLIERERKIKKEKRSFYFFPFQNITTNKKLIWFLFLNCTLLEIFVCYITLKSFDLAIYTASNPDFTPLVTLVGAVVGEVIGYAIYAMKATKENSVGGITYDMAMAEKFLNDEPPPQEENVIEEDVVNEDSAMG